MSMDTPLDAAESTPEPEAEYSAPWVHDPGRYDVRSVAAREVRPGWWIFVKEERRFMAVVSVSVLHRRVVFIDLADGSTLALEGDVELYARSDTP